MPLSSCPFQRTAPSALPQKLPPVLLKRLPQQVSPYIQSQNQTQINTRQQQVTETVLKDEKNLFAELDVSTQNTAEGKKFDEATDSLVDEDGKAVKDKSFKMNVKRGADSKETSENYRTRVSELGKSYLAHIESKSSDGADNEGISLEEFTEHEMDKLGDDISDEEKAEYEQRAENAFNKIDINNDGQIDWKEYSAAIMTFDQKAGTKPKGTTNDGQISSSDYEQWSTLMSDSKQNMFDLSIRRNYKELFDESEDE